MRWPYAADVLRDEVTALYPKAAMKPQDDEDGLGVHRVFRFDKRTSAELAPVLEFLGDQRLHSVKMTDAGYLYVEFSSESRLADLRDPFMVKLAGDILAGNGPKPYTLADLADDLIGVND